MNWMSFAFGFAAGVLATVLVALWLLWPIVKYAFGGSGRSGN